MRTYVLHATRLAALGLSLLLFASTANAQSEVILDNDDGEYKIEFVSAVVVGGNTIFTYHVSELSGKNLSNFLIELCIDDEDLIVATNPTANELHVFPGGDPNYGIAGVKWEVNDDFVEGDFSFTLAGVYAVGPTGAAAKNGNNIATGFINGPDCSSDPCVPENKPSWDGNFVGGDPGPGKGYFVLQTPQGFDQIELTFHNNIALTGLAAPDGSPIIDATIGGTALTGPVGSGGTLLVYTGAAALTEVRVNVTALTENGSRFMFQVEDGCGFTAQLDPVVQLAVPSAISLNQNYPNPFNPQTSIRFQLPEASNVSLVVYDALGRQVKTLVSGEVGAGDHEALWDGTDASGLRVPSGVYLYRLEAGNVVQTRRMTMLK